MLARSIGRDLIASFLQTTFHRGPEGRIVVNNMHNPRHEFLLREQWYSKPEHGPPVGIATLASHATQDQVNNHAAVEPDHPGQEHDEIVFAADRTDIGRSGCALSCEQNPARTMQKRQQYKKTPFGSFCHSPSDMRVTGYSQ